MIVNEKATYNKRMSYGGIDLVKGKLHNDLKCMPSPEFDKFLLEHNYFEEKGSPFSWVMMFYRYGIKTDLKVEFKRINKK